MAISKEDLADRAKSMRAAPTDAERAAWRLLQARRLARLHFRRQVVIGPFILDFVCHRERLAIEIDGGQHATDGDYDARRSAWLAARGYRVLRFWNNEVLENPDGVRRSILVALGSG